MKFGSGTQSIRWGLLRGESAVASIGLAVAVLLVVTLTACGAWLVRAQRQTAEAARIAQIETVADLLAATSEPMLASGTQAVRRQLMDASARHALDRVRVVTPSGQIVTDTVVVAADADPQTFEFSGHASEPELSIAAGVAVVKRPVLVHGRGWATLEVTAPLDALGQPNWEARAGVGGIGAVSLMALLVVYRYHRSKLMGVGAVREALLEMHRGETSEAALRLAGDLGIEADQWNTMLAEQQRLRRLAAVQQTKQSLGTLTNDSDDLSSGCDAMPQGLVMVDDALRVKYVNHAAALFLRQPRESMEGRELDAMLPAPELQKALREAVASSRRATYLMDRRDEPGGGVLRFIIRPVRRVDASSAMVVIEDVTQQRVAEEARHEFVAHATHELRAPLTNIRLYLESLLDDSPQEPAARAKCLNVINSETRRLERMIGDLLSVAEIEAGSLKLNRNDVDLLAILHEVEQDFGAQATEKQVGLEIRMPPKLPVLYADRDKIVMAIQNVVGNGIKYTPAGGNVTVVADTVKGDVVIEVRDTGLGIKPEEHEKIFEKFYRANDRRISGVTGSGLGLALAREVMRLHGGDLTVDSGIDQGSVFTLRIPIQQAK